MIGRRNKCILLFIVYEWQEKVTKVKCERDDESTSSLSIFLEYILLEKKHLSQLTAARSQNNSKLDGSRPGKRYREQIFI